MQHVFLTGQPGIGKSTVVARILQRLQESSKLPDSAIAGFYTEEVRSGTERVGFDIVTLGPTRLRGPLARVGAPAKVRELNWQPIRLACANMVAKQW